MSGTNKRGESLFQIASRYPQTKKENFEAYLMELERKNDYKPKETLECVVKEAEKKANEITKLLLAKPLWKLDPLSISKKVSDITDYIQKRHFDEKVFGDDQKFYLHRDPVSNETFLESTISLGMQKEQSEILDVMIKVDEARYEQQEDASYRIKRQVKKAVPSSSGLRECLESIEEKYPWSRSKYFSKLAVCFLVQVIIGTLSYALDVGTDVNFIHDKFVQSHQNFSEGTNECHSAFIKKLEDITKTCKVDFSELACLEPLKEIKQLGVNCKEKEKNRLMESHEWRKIGIISSVNLIISFLAAFIIWLVLQTDKKWDFDIFHLPLPFLTKMKMFYWNKKLFDNYSWEERNSSKKNKEEFEVEKKRCLNKLADQENRIILSLIIEASVEATFQFFFQTVFLLPKILVTLISVGSLGVAAILPWNNGALFTWEFFSIYSSFFTFAWAFHSIR